MSASLELILAVFDGEGHATQVLQGLKDLGDEQEKHLFDVAVLSKDRQGKTTVEEIRDLRSRRGSLFGAIVGGVIGLLGGPAGALLGAAAGAVTGGVVANVTDLGFSDAFLAELKQALQPGHSALLALVEVSWAEDCANYLERRGGRLLRHALRQELVERLRSLS
jgi:uncharacterized membrane protein